MRLLAFVALTSILPAHSTVEVESNPVEEETPPKRKTPLESCLDDASGCGPLRAQLVKPEALTTFIITVLGAMGSNSRMRDADIKTLMLHLDGPEGAVQISISDCFHRMKFGKLRDIPRGTWPVGVLTGILGKDGIEASKPGMRICNIMNHLPPLGNAAAMDRIE